MRSLTLDFLHPRPRTHWLSWLLLTLGIVLSIWTGWQNRQLDLALQKETARETRLRPESRIRPSVRQDDSRENAEALSARNQLALPWDRFFAGLERVQSRRIALISLEADGRKTEASLTAEAKNLRDMLAYIEKLKKEAGFKSVVLASHQLQEEDPQLPVRFVLRLRWRN